MDYFHEGHECVDECSQGHFLSDNSCLQCPTNCSECWEIDECTECVPGKFLHGSSCVDECTKGYTGTQGICIPCITGCDTCDSESQKETISKFYIFFLQFFLQFFFTIMTHNL